MTIAENLKKAKRILKENEVDEVSLKAKILLAHILGIKREFLIVKSDEEMSKTLEEDYITEIYRLAKGYPLEYIVRQKRVYAIGTGG